MSDNRFGIKEVADVWFYRLNEDGTKGEPVLCLDTLKVSNIEQSADSADAKGGKGDAPLIIWDYNKEINITLEDALLSETSLEMVYGKDEDGIITISANTFPGVYYVIGRTFARDMKTGKDRLMSFVIPKAKIMSENTIAMEAEGDPTVFNMSLRALRDKDGKMVQLIMGVGEDDLIISTRKGIFGEDNLCCDGLIEEIKGYPNLEIHLPQNIDFISKGAFADVKGLDTFEADGYTHFEDYENSFGAIGAFQNCENLVSVKFFGSGSANFNIPPYAFSNCRSLKEIKLPKKPCIIKEYAFYGTSLSQIDLSECPSVEIYSGAFHSNEKLTKILLPSDFNYRNTSTFDGVSPFVYNSALEVISGPE